jgi:inosine-uridine nucleoside N-ribohydrolase
MIGRIPVCLSKNKLKKVHLDTDLGGDIDDLCALAMLLRWPEGVNLCGITTVGEINGKRAGYVRYILGLEGRMDIPVAAGADISQGYYRYELGLPPEQRYWPEPVSSSPNRLDKALQLLKDNIEQEATIICIGPLTNLSLLENQYPGILTQAKLFLMGGYVYPSRSGYPDWGNEMDFNFQADVSSAKGVIQSSNPTLIPISVTAETSLRKAYLDELKKSGALGQLIARQGEAFAMDEKYETIYGETCAGLPGDIINFQHDPLACAVALGWDKGIEIEEVPLLLEESEGWLTESVHPSGKPVRVVTAVDGPRFNEFWISVIIQ